MKVAACQMTAVLGDVAGNLARAERLLEEAFSRGARWVVLPEFFPTASAFHPSMHDAGMPLEGPALELLRRAARRHQGYAGGSFICERDGERYNSFVLVEPDGSYHLHDKDIPTMWENCYYTGGNDDGAFEVGDLRVGAILCWEFIRRATAERLRGKVDLVLGASAWWGYPRMPVLRTLLARDDRNALEILRGTFSRMARILGVPVVHANHAGPLRGRTPMLPLPYHSDFMGETQIVDGAGSVLARLSREDGEGVIVAEIEPGEIASTEPLGNGFWIPELPWSLRASWAAYNAHGRRYYARMRRRGIY